MNESGANVESSVPEWRNDVYVSKTGINKYFIYKIKI